MEIPLFDFSEQVRALSAADQPPPLKRYNELATFDPYPGIPPALLHAGHLASYAITTGMIDPFEVDALEKPATYLVPLEGPVRFLNEDGKRQSFYLSNKAICGERDVRKEFELMPNSLCYVTLRPIFRMPAYIAGRFNLLIRDVYRGLLVGTGPLVDPGFTGHLSIPVHNFTSNKYVLRAGEGFVYFEFTKLAWSNPERPRAPCWIRRQIDDQPPFPGTKNKRRNIDDYLIPATGGGPAQNAVQKTVSDLGGVARAAQSSSNVVKIGAIVTALVFGLTALGVMAAAFQLYLGSQQFTQSAQTDIAKSISQIQSDLKELRRAVDTNRPTKAAP